MQRSLGGCECGIFNAQRESAGAVMKESEHGKGQVREGGLHSRIQMQLKREMEDIKNNETEFYS